MKQSLWELGLTMDTLLQCRPEQLLQPAGPLAKNQLALIESWLRARGLMLQRSPEPNVQAAPSNLEMPDPGEEARLTRRLERFRKMRKA